MRALSCVLHPKKKRFARVCKLGVFVALILYNFIFSVTKQEKERLWTYPAAILAESSTLALAFPSAWSWSLGGDMVVFGNLIWVTTFLQNDER